MRYFQKSLVIMKISSFPLDLEIREYELNVDLIRTPFLFNADSYQIPETISPSDLNPINFTASINNAELSISSTSDQINVDIHRASNRNFQSLLEWPFGDPVRSDFGLTFDESQMQQEIFPIFEHTIFGTIRSSSLIIIHMPDGRFLHLKAQIIVAKFQSLMEIKY